VGEYNLLVFRLASKRKKSELDIRMVKCGATVATFVVTSE
jgi:hypothetical protein